MSDKLVPTNSGLPKSTPQDPVQLEIQKAQLEARQQRQVKITALLGQAADVLKQELDMHTSAIEKHKAVELAIDLYDVAARAELTNQKLEIEREKIELEKAKLSTTPLTPPFLQQNNVYFSNQPTQEQQQELLERKQAQNAILESFLPKKTQEQASLLDQEDTEE